MNEEQQVAYVIAMSVQGMIRAMGMQAANSQHPQDQPYSEEDFKALIDEFGIHHNSILGLFFPGG